MQKTILITGSTDGIGLATAKMLVSQGHRVLIHGRSAAKLAQAETTLAALSGGGRIETYLADLSLLDEVETLAKTIAEHHDKLDALINNAGVYSTPEPVTQDGLDVRFVVNTIAPYLLTQRLMPLLGASARIVNLSSAAQSPVDPTAIGGGVKLSDNAAYAQSKLAITMWSRTMTQTLGDNAPMIVAVNPASLLGSKMVKDAFGVDGGDIDIGADILVRAALSDEFANASGQYYDNDAKRFGSPHQDALDEQKSNEVVRAIEAVLAGKGHSIG
jgi:NAD(P)-dependent dehydrogenase (short-subunit alcohol dehydrogenase family)